MHLHRDDWLSRRCRQIPQRMSELLARWSTSPSPAEGSIVPIPRPSCILDVYVQADSRGLCGRAIDWDLPVFMSIDDWYFAVKKLEKHQALCDGCATVLLHLIEETTDSGLGEMLR